MVPSDTIEYDRESRKVSGLRADYEAVFGYTIGVDIITPIHTRADGRSPLAAPDSLL